jgi:hypothetical protein
MSRIMQMLSTDVRLRVEFICQRIAKRQEVQLSDMQWIQKWANCNHSVEAQLRKARRVAVNGESSADSLDGFMQNMDIGEPDPAEHLTGAQDPTTLAEWFTQKRKWFRGSAE